jgi:hypothetical protein
MPGRLIYSRAPPMRIICWFHFGNFIISITPILQVLRFYNLPWTESGQASSNCVPVTRPTGSDRMNPDMFPQRTQFVGHGVLAGVLLEPHAQSSFSRPRCSWRVCGRVLC